MPERAGRTILYFRKSTSAQVARMKVDLVVGLRSAAFLAAENHFKPPSCLR